MRKKRQIIVEVLLRVLLECILAVGNWYLPTYVRYIMLISFNVCGKLNAESFDIIKTLVEEVL